MPERYIWEDDLPDKDSQIDAIINKYAKKYEDFYKKIINGIPDEQERNNKNGDLGRDKKIILGLAGVYKQLIREQYVADKKTTVILSDSISRVIDTMNYISGVKDQEFYQIAYSCDEKIKSSRISCRMPAFYLFIRDILESVKREAGLEGIAVALTPNKRVTRLLTGKREFNLSLIPVRSDQSIRPDKIKEKLKEWGWSAKIIGNGFIVRIHVS